MPESPPESGPPKLIESSRDLDRLRFDSANVPFAALGQNDPLALVASQAGDFFGSFLNSEGENGNPGVYVIPAPGALALLGMGGLIGLRRRH